MIEFILWIFLLYILIMVLSLISGFIQYLARSIPNRKSDSMSMSTVAGRNQYFLNKAKRGK